MKREMYKKPMMMVVEMQHYGMLMQSGSENNRRVGTKGSIRGWNDGGTTDEDIYM